MEILYLVTLKVTFWSLGRPNNTFQENRIPLEF